MSIVCPHCGTISNAEPRLYEHTIKCSSCGGRIRIAPQALSDRQRKRQLRYLIAAAASGEQTAIEKLLSPFISPEETLVRCGISAEFGLLFKTYDFYFLTDKKIGDLQVSPFSGDLSVEVGFIQDIDAYVIIQPAIRFLTRLLLWSTYLMLPVLFFLTLGPMFRPLLGSFAFYCLVCGSLFAGVALNYLVTYPFLIRTYLRLKKSGLWLKLSGYAIGVLIFSDRNKLDLLAGLARKLSEFKKN